MKHKKREVEVFSKKCGHLKDIANDIYVGHQKS